MGLFEWGMGGVEGGRGKGEGKDETGRPWDVGGLSEGKGRLGGEWEVCTYVHRCRCKLSKILDVSSTFPFISQSEPASDLPEYLERTPSPSPTRHPSGPMGGRRRRRL